MSGVQHFKVVVAGMINAGKSTFVEGIANLTVLSLTNPPRREIEEERPTNIRSGVATEAGYLEIDGEVSITLYSMASNLASISSLPRGMHGYVVLVDSTDERSFYEGRALLLYMFHFPRVPYIVVANKQDIEGALTVEQVRQKMRLPDYVPMMGCIARERDSVRNVLLELLYKILGV